MIAKYLTTPKLTAVKYDFTTVHQKSGRIQLGNSSIFHDSRVQIGKLTCLELIETTRKLNSAYIVDLCVISEGWWSKVARLLT